MTVFEAIETRRSVRVYENRPVEEEKLQRVLEAGRLAPSAKNCQNRVFVVVRNPALRERMKGACCGQDSVGQAPVVLVVCATQTSVMTCGQPRETVDCSIALSFMMLEAAAQGLGGCWLGAFKADEVCRVLDLPEGMIPVAVYPLGYPAEAPPPRPRKSAGEVILWK